MKKIVIMIVALVSCIVMSAQDVKVKSKVELKNGNEVVGYITEQSDGSYLVETEAGDMFFYSASEIKKIVEIENMKVKTVKLTDKPQIDYRSKGYMGMVSGLFGTNTGISIINGYRFSPHFFLGVETGVGYATLAEIIQTPKVNLYLMSEFSKKRVAMFADLSCGLYFDLDSEAASPQATVTLGVRNRFKRNPNLAMWWGLNLGMLSYVYYWEDYYEEGFIPAVSLKIAFSF